MILNLMTTIDDYFICVYKKAIQLNKFIEPENLLLIQGIYKKFYIVDRNDITDLNITSLGLEHIPHTWYIDNILRYYNYGYNYSDWIYPYTTIKSNEEMINEPISILQRYNKLCLDIEIWKKANILVRIEYDTHDQCYNVNYYINIDVINNIVIGKREPRSNLLFSMIEHTKRNEIEKKCLNELTDILNNVSYNYYPEIENQKLNNNSIGLKDNFTLYNYQKNDILWMENIEHNINIGNNKIDYKYSISYEALNDFIVFNGNLIPKQFKFDPGYQNTSVEYYGGNLISQVGLGKTLITLCHIANTRQNEFDFYVEKDTTCSYFYKRGMKKGQSCNKQKEGEFFCKEHRHSIFVDKPKMKLVNLENLVLRNYIVSKNNSSYLRTNSSLIICPNHLCDEWIKEYLEKMYGLRVIIIVTYDQYCNLTLADILFSDIVIVSYQFLMNPNYANKRQNLMFVDDIRRLFDQSQHENYKDMIEELMLTPRTCNLGMFNWKRVILDEFHEIRRSQKNNLLYQIIMNFSSDYKWNISATPFANGLNGFLDVLNFITSKRLPYFSKIQDWGLDSLLEYGFDSDIIHNFSNLFKRNTKSSIQNEYIGNQINNTIHLLDFTEQERIIYESYKLGHKDTSVDFLIKMCCHVELFRETKNLIENCKTLDEVKYVIINYNEQQKTEYHKQLTTLQNDINNLSKLIDQEIIEEAISLLRQELGNKKRQHKNVSKIYEKIESTSRYLTSVMNSISHGDKENCPICLDEIEDDLLTILSCGHKYCWNCIYHLAKMYEHEKEIKCPHCNCMIDKNNIYRIKNSMNENNVHSHSYKDNLNTIIQEVKSTKIGNIIYYLKNYLQENDKCILFSQWEPLLKKVGEILESYNIGVMTLHGNVYQKKNQIHAFKNDKNIKILLLSSNNAASGMNLTVANKIIFLEPVYGNKEYRENIENQAIGRSDRISQTRPIEVIRFIIKNTVEEEIINQ